MKTQLYLLFLLSLTTGAANAKTVTADEAAMDRVVVYQDRAQIDRTLTVTVPAGRSEVTFTNLPSPLLPGSVRARVGDDVTSVEVIGLTQREEVHLAQRRAEVQQLLDEIRDLQGDIRAQQVEEAALQSRLEQIAQMRAYTRTTVAARQTDPGVDTEAFDRTLDLFVAESEAAISQRSKLQAKAADLESQIASRQQRIADLQYGSDRTTTTVSVTVEADRGGSAPLVLTYGVGGVSWSPRYDLRYRDDQLTLAYMAEVRQSSGEDWDDVRLVFTTARPDEMVPPPANQPLYLSGYKEKEETVQLGSLHEEGQDDWSPPDSGVVAAGAGETVAVVQRSLAVDLELLRSASVPADGRPYRIAVLEQALDSELDRYAAPSLSPHVFLRAQTSNQTGLQLLSGPADVFLCSGYVGTMPMPDLAPGEELAVSLGPAGPITVSREFDAQRNRVVERSLGRKKVHFVHDLVIHNYGGDSMTVVVEEAIPVSRVDQVKVEIDEETTAGFEIAKDESLYTWTLSLAGGEEKRVHLEYVVDLPEDYAWEGY